MGKYETFLSTSMFVAVLEKTVGGFANKVAEERLCI